MTIKETLGGYAIAGKYAMATGGVSGLGGYDAFVRPWLKGSLLAVVLPAVVGGRPRVVFVGAMDAPEDPPIIVN